MSIDPLTPPGTKILFNYPKRGIAIDQEMAAKNLVIGAQYTVRKIVPGLMFHRVFLMENLLSFPTSMFEHIEQERYNWHDRLWDGNAPAQTEDI